VGPESGATDNDKVSASVSFEGVADGSKIRCEEYTGAPRPQGRSELCRE